MALHFKMAVHHDAAISLTDVVTVTLLFTALGALGRAGRGLWNISAGAH